MINLNKNTQYDTSPLLRLGFRPFFFASGMIAIISILMWMVFYPSLILINNANLIDWHAHEMIFAYASAVTVGFLLTASKNWTGIQTIYNKPLLALLLLWVSGRFLPFVTHEYLVYQAVLDTSFLIFSTLAIAWPIIKAKNWNNVSIVAKLVLLSVAHILFYLGLLNIVDQGVYFGIYLGFYLIISLLFMMSRRLLPFFIERGLGLKTELKNSKFLDLLSLFLFLGFMIAEIFFQTIISHILAGSLFIIHSIKLFNWYHKGIWKKPLLWSIYLAYVFLTLGFGLYVASYFINMMPNISTHSFAFGIALMTLSMMARVSLGHTGRNVFQPPKQINLMFILLSLAFVTRVLLVSIFPEHYATLIFTSQLLWISAFSWFAFIYSPMFFKARVDGQFG
ncbi:NnrS protein involved in response to NO [uncultured Candidatus Thioglobus sp.]|nr:NnrS protein involved in response to NO [uncultured Candidatus Thioglobus sp.]